METSSKLPVIGIPADRRYFGPHPFQLVGEKYIDALVRGARALPWLIPVLPEPLPVSEMLCRVDALLFTGSPSNVEPHHYDGEPSAPGTLHDPQRDATTLALIRAAIAAGVPVLGICRGFQEINVALGGTLWQQLGPASGHGQHAEDTSQPVERQYAPTHALHLERTGLLHGWSDGSGEVQVNSLHSQGIRELAPGLEVEARASDGLIEAFRVAAAPAFAFAVQWHPEWQAMDNALSRALFEALGAAAELHAARPNAAETSR